MSFWAAVRALSERLGYYAPEAETCHAFSPKRVAHYSTHAHSAKLGVRLSAEQIDRLPDGVGFDGDANVLVASGGIDVQILAALIQTDQRKGWKRCVDSLHRQVTENPPLTLAESEVDDVATYLNTRCQMIQRCEALLQDAAEGRMMYERSRIGLKAPRTAAMNKQSGKKRQIAYLTATVMNLLDREVGSSGYVADPRSLPKFVKGGVPVLTMSRWPDGLLPGYVNPQIVWEIKEHYHTTTFGSRVSASVYETLLDGYEMSLLNDTGVERPMHLVFVDGKKTWWEDGKAYLARLFDAMHMKHVDEVLIGVEVEKGLPELLRRR